MEDLRILLSRCLALFIPEKLDGGVDEEVHRHVEANGDKHRQCGVQKDATRNAELRPNGKIMQIKQAYSLRRGLPYAEQMRQDVHFGFRQLRKSPGFALTAILGPRTSAPLSDDAAHTFRPPLRAS